MFNAINVQNLMSADRAVFYRETAAGMYGPWAYASATGLAEVPYLVAQSLVMVCVAYWMVRFRLRVGVEHDTGVVPAEREPQLCFFVCVSQVGFQPVAWKFFYFLLMFFQGLACYTYMGQCLVFCMPTVMMSLLLTTFLSQIWTIVCVAGRGGGLRDLGGGVPFSALRALAHRLSCPALTAPCSNGYLIPYSQIPVYWQWLNRISPATWCAARAAAAWRQPPRAARCAVRPRVLASHSVAPHCPSRIIYGLGTSQLGDNDAPMDALDGTATTVSAFLASFFGYDYSFIWWAYVIVLAFTVVFMLGSALSLRYLNFNRR